MELRDKVAIVTGGASGLGLATVEELIRSGARAAIFDLQEERGKQAAERLGRSALFARVDVTDEASLEAGLAQVASAFGAVHVCVNCAGVADAAKTVSRGKAFALSLFEKVIRINLIGSFNVLRLAALRMSENPPDENGERGVIVNTASAAAFDGQVGQAAYAASKAGIVGLSLPVARDLAMLGIRVNAIAPGLFHTPMMEALPQATVDKIVEDVQYPHRLGRPSEFAALVRHIVENPYLNGECIRLDAATRLPPR
jgi:NAD(P)-dependent dehydrogenase (short-subunit alcohol dehydrogenase family)